MYRPFILTLLLFTFVCTCVRAQQDFSFPLSLSRIYPVSAQVVESLFTGDMAVADLPDLGPELPPGTRQDTLPDGHYLEAIIRGENVNYRYFATYRHRLTAEALKGKLTLRLHDPEGRSRADARILADGKPVRYVPKHQAYQRRDWRADYLRVSLDGDTLFYRVNEDINHSRFSHELRQVYRFPPVYYAAFPYRTARNSYHYLKRGFRRGDWRWYRYPLEGKIRRLINPPKEIGGYVTTSQPRYRPGDTLRVHAYLSKPQGRPLFKDSIYVSIYQRQPYTKRLLRKIGREKPGWYSLELPIPADWPLDREYHVTLTKGGIFTRDIAPGIRFHLEDYELDEYRLALKTSTNARTAGGAWIDLKADDINGLPLPDGQLTVTAKINRFGALLEDSPELKLPDTLYFQQLPTDDRIDHRIVLPDSIFPEGYAVQLSTKVQLKGPSGEYQEKTVQLYVNRLHPVYPEIKVLGDSLDLRLVPRDNNQAITQARLFLINARRDTLVREVQLPLQLPLDHQLQSLALEYRGQTARRTLTGLRPVGPTSLSWSRDTLRLNFPDRHRQEFRWSLYADNRLVAEGDQAQTNFEQPGFASATMAVLQYSYFAGGRWQAAELREQAPKYFGQTAHPKLLDLELIQPEVVRPGASVRVEVRATDHAGKPAANVQLAAGSYNARFKDSPVTTPTYLQREKGKRRRQGYEEVPLNWAENAIPPRWLVEGLELDTLLAYQLRYPDPEFRLLRDLDRLLPAELTIAHLAPFVLKNHVPQLIRTVYADDRLVYWWHPNITTPYSIPVDSGWHEIELRTDTYRYSKRLHLPARRQLVISFDGDHGGGAGWQVVKQEKNKAAEVNLLHQQVFALTKMQSSGTFTFRRGHQGMLRTGRANRYGNFHPLGLATAGNKLDFWFPRGDSLRLAFEPKAAYRISLGRDRLYPLEKNILERALSPAPHATPPAAPGLPAYRYRKPLLTPFRRQKPTHVWQLPKVLPEEEAGRIQLMGLPDSLITVSVAFPEEDIFSRLALKKVNRLKASTYDLLYHFRNDSVFHRRVEVAADSLSLLLYDRKKLDYYDQYSDHFGYLHTRPQPVPEPEEVQYPDFTFGNGKISGVVVDTDDEPLIGASIQIKGTNKGTVTDIDGRFELEVPEETYALVVTYTGFLTQQLDDLPGGGSAAQLVVVMKESSAMLSEVVVVGYGVAKKKQALTASAVRIVQDNTVQSMQGRVAGVVVSGGVSKELQKEVDLELPTQETLPPPTLRTIFSDYAAHLSALRTDASGRAVFDLPFPDDITAWNTYAVGQDRRRRVGFTLAQTTAFLPLQAQLYLPRFLVEGDQSEASALAINRSDTERRVRLQFSGEHTEARTQDAKLRTSIAKDFPITTVSGADSLTYRFSLTTLDGEPESDGEERHLPVYPRGTEMINGELLLLTKKRNRLPTEFIRPERGDVHLQLLGNRLQQLLKDVDHVVNYPYACTEQTASRLVGLLALGDIRQAEGKPFTRAADVKKMIARLEKRHRPDGGFGWWPGSDASSHWISLHVFRALSYAGERGYLVQDLSSVRRYLLAVAPELPLTDQLQIALALAEAGLPPTNAEMDRFVTLDAPNDYELLVLSRLQQLRGDTVAVQRLVDSSSRHAVLGRYWGERRFRFFRQPLDDRLACGLLAQRIFQTAGREELTAETVNYLLGQRPTGNRPGTEPLLGTNTLESARLIADLLSYLLKDEDRLRPLSVTLRMENNTIQVANFPYKTVIGAEDIPGLSIERSGSGPLPVSLYQRWFAAEPTEQAAGFQLSTRLLDQRGRELDQLTKGTTAYLETTVEVAADANYVLIEIPIPAACSYVNRNEARGSFAVHREYRRDRVAIFCDRLPTGTYTYRVALAPRFAGTYSLNPPRAEMQYVPTVNGNGIVREVVVK